MKSFWSEFKSQFSLAHIAFLLLASVLIIPILVMLLRKVPGVSTALDKVPAPLVILTAVLGLAIASPTHAADTVQIVASAGAPSLTSHVTPVMATAVPTAETFFVMAVAVIVAGVISLFAVRRRAASFFASLFVICGLSVLFAADTSPFARLFTQLIIKQGTTLDSQTNSFRVYAANGTNYFHIDSNAVPHAIISGSNWTGFTGTILTTNGTLGRVNFGYVNGLLVVTN